MENKFALLNKKYAPIDCAQFFTLAQQFKAASQIAAGDDRTIDDVEIVLMDREKASSTFADDAIEQADKAYNDQHTILRTHNISDITEDVWSKTLYAEMTIKKDSFWAAAEIVKQYKNQGIQMYIQGADQDRADVAKIYMETFNPHMVPCPGFN